MTMNTASYGRLLPGLIIFLLLAASIPALSLSTTRAAAQEESRAFPETGKTVKGKFLRYWLDHGEVARQGYPISDELLEASDTDGKVYVVQYFQRAVFELHPENKPPNDVLLALLSVSTYKQKYPNGAPGQQPNNQANSRIFTQTGKRLGGVFLDYWLANGGLAQMGYPISDEFTEVSVFDGKPYRIQYFERSVLEYHPENRPPYNVLVPQLGVLRYKAKYPQDATTSGAQPPGAGVCDVSGTTGGKATPSGVRQGESVVFEVSGFSPGEGLHYQWTQPNGQPLGPAQPAPWTPGVDGKLTLPPYLVPANWATGRWALRLRGVASNHISTIYFCVAPAAPQDAPSRGQATCDISGTRNGRVTPSSAKPGEAILFEVWGFTPGEGLTYQWTAPDGKPYEPAKAAPWTPGPDGKLSIPPYPIPANWSAGRWALSVRGVSSGHVSVVYFCVAK